LLIQKPQGGPLVSRGQSREGRFRVKIRRRKHHVHRRALADGKLPGAMDVIQQLSFSGVHHGRLFEAVDRRHRNGGQDADNRNHYQQFEQREPRPEPTA